MEDLPNHHLESIQERHGSAEFDPALPHPSDTNIECQPALKTPDGANAEAPLGRTLPSSLADGVMGYPSQGNHAIRAMKQDNRSPAIADSRVIVEDFTPHKSGSQPVEESTVRGSSDMNLASPTSTSNISSPLLSAYASSASLRSSQASNHLGIGGDGYHEYRPDGFLMVTHGSSEAAIPSNITSSTPSSVAATPRQETSQSPRGGPHHLTQPFSTLHHVQPSKLPHIPQAQTSNSPQPQHSDLASDHSQKPRGRPSISSNTNTITPSQSSGLFSVQNSDGRTGGAVPREGQYNTPLLHPTHLQPPKE
jgi:hypothetical protein